MKRTWTFLLWLSFLLASCSSRLPAQRPDDFYVGYGTSSGMTPFGTSVYVSSEESHISFFSYGVNVDVTFRPEPAELDALYQAFVDNQFDLIQTYEEEVYDRGGSNITLTANGRTYDKANGGMSFVKEAWSGSYGNVSTAIEQFVNRSAPNAQTFVVEWDESLATLYPNIKIDMGADFLNLSNSGALTGGTDRTAIVSTSNPNGSYQIVVEMTSSVPSSASYTLDLTQTQYLLISVGEDGVKFEPQNP